MTRRDYLKMATLLGISIPAQSIFNSCNKEDNATSNPVNPSTSKGKVLIIGAGTGGLTAGYLLNQMGIEFQILEASQVYGGRMKRSADFTNFPIPLGAEWIHIGRDILNEIVNKISVYKPPHMKSKKSMRLMRALT